MTVVPALAWNAVASWAWGRLSARIGDAPNSKITREMIVLNIIFPRRLAINLQQCSLSYNKTKVEDRISGFYRYIWIKQFFSGGSDDHASGRIEIRGCADGHLVGK